MKKILERLKKLNKKSIILLVGILVVLSVATIILVKTGAITKISRTIQKRRISRI